MDIKQRTEWLNEFQRGHKEATYAIGIVAGLAEDLHTVGLDGVADNLTLPLHVLRSAVALMNDSVSRMIYEQADASSNTIGETLHALLQTTSATSRGMGGDDGN